MTTAIAVQIEDPRWRRRLPKIVSLVRRAARAALTIRPGPARAELSFMLTDDARMQVLNRAYRQKDAPTNVLSFPAQAASPDGTVVLGDVVLAFETCVTEAKAQAKTLRDHLCHLVVHGVLHLLGHDHLRARAAERMERLERRILAKLGIADPYLLRSAAP